MKINELVNSNPKPNVRIHFDDESTNDVYFETAKENTNQSGKNSAWVEYSEFWEYLETVQNGKQVVNVELIKQKSLIELAERATDEIIESLPGFTVDEIVKGILESFEEKPNEETI